MSYLFTSESVTCGHPDKICDQVSDSILDAVLAQDPNSKVAIDTWVKDNTLGLIGEITTSAIVDFEKIARNTVNKIGYNRDDLGFNGHNFEYISRIGLQSKEINQAVVASDDENLGAGDQGIMFGYATKQTKELMPLPIMLAHLLAKNLHKLRIELESQNDFRLRPDGKTQVTIQYSDDHKIENIHTILISSQHSDKINQEELKNLIIEKVILPTIKNENLEVLCQNPRFLINPSGSFILGGPVADSGLTGRKIVVDSYGGWSRVGGGAFSGKDSTKVDRSSAYVARYIAKQLVAKNFADDVELQLSYSIGKAEPTSVSVFGNLNKSQNEILKYISDNFDLRPGKIIAELGLNLPIFEATATYGHFGQIDKNFSWEKTD